MQPQEARMPLELLINPSLYMCGIMLTTSSIELSLKMTSTLIKKFCMTRNTVQKKMNTVHSNMKIVSEKW